ncbi:hypothetical protein GCM10011490_17980 [Pseudoclavibacter endophyticus]|uniref:Uncharacterized protein n=1 Tax=Pseudoclavibacter endophyticus TaxID=1778590 RepID=A0A6H9WRB2_9MICO|nr:hypothetical protein [Pseudoclavibacter endophyticus]KAB1648854.1 hypothetical protein F8O04_00675 [Pseudoclavibacter endophyticus]GGA67811.1 hypothetical protein GCM10011490_17980 [Pseudoclavibacter endophyticus]
MRNPDDYAERDRLARELVALAKSGHAGADQVLLMAMLPRVVHLTRTCRGLRNLPLRDAQAIALGAMWEAIRVHPESQTTAILHRLGMDALAIVTRTHSSHVTSPELTTDPETMTRLREAEEPAPGAVDELAAVLRWGLESNAITSEDVRVIAAVDLGAKGDRERLAHELGIGDASIVRRAHRVRARLKQAVAAEVERLGSW